jgi:hypothetical protein
MIEPIGKVPPAEADERYYAMLAPAVIGSGPISALRSPPRRSPSAAYITVQASMGASLHVHRLEADGAGFGALGAQPVSNSLPGVWAGWFFISDREAPAQAPCE